MASPSCYSLPGHFTLACGLCGSFCGDATSGLTPKHTRLAKRYGRLPGTITRHSDKDNQQDATAPITYCACAQLYQVLRTCTVVLRRETPYAASPKMAGLAPISPIRQQSYKIHSYHCPEREGTTGTAPSLP